MGQALYRKYRSKKLSEIVGQEHITQTLDRAIKNGKVSHAYLFTGPRGVGKTSVARILAHEINELPYTDESTHLDIIEIDAASNRRIDEIRDLREKVHIAPTSAKYKVYIIDEVHMLTREAFNALLKTLEEPPAHVVFILATTEIHKLPETIVSRTQRFTFKPIDPQVATKHLEEIAQSEGIKIDTEALVLLAEHGRGSFRDSISLLDQVGHSADEIHAEDVRTLIGLASDEHVAGLFQAITSGDANAIVQALNQCTNDGVSPAQAAKQLSEHVRAHVINTNPSDTSVFLDLLGDLVSVPASSEPATAFEIALFRAQLALREPIAQASHIQEKITAKEPKEKAAPVEVPQPKIEKPKKSDTKKLAEPEVTPSPASGDPAEWWDDVLQHIKTVNNTLYGVLRMAEPRVDNDTLHLSFGFGFHKRKAANADTQAKIHEAITKVTGASYQINAIHDERLGNQKPEKPASKEATKPTSQPSNSELSSITNIFGGGEVLES